MASLIVDDSLTINYLAKGAGIELLANLERVGSKSIRLKEVINNTIIGVVIIGANSNISGDNSIVITLEIRGSIYISIC